MSLNPGSEVLPRVCRSEQSVFLFKSMKTSKEELFALNNVQALLRKSNRLFSSAKQRHDNYPLHVWCCNYPAGCTAARRMTLQLQLLRVLTTAALQYRIGFERLVLELDGLRMVYYLVFCFQRLYVQYQYISRLCLGSPSAPILPVIPDSFPFPVLLFSQLTTTCEHPQRKRTLVVLLRLLHHRETLSPCDHPNYLIATTN